VASKDTMNSRETPVNPRERWHPLAKLGVNYKSFGLNEGHFCRNCLAGKNLQIYGFLANSSPLPIRTYGAERRVARPGVSARAFQQRTLGKPREKFRKCTVIRSNTTHRSSDSGTGHSANRGGRMSSQRAKMAAIACGATGSDREPPTTPGPITMKGTWVSYSYGEP
jgi:hypothetical protein